MHGVFFCSSIRHFLQGNIRLSFTLMLIRDVCFSLFQLLQINPEARI